MPRGEAYRDPSELPEEFQVYSQDAQQAAMDAYNGAIADGLATGEALQMAHTAAKSVDQGTETGQLNATPSPAPAGGGTNELAQTLRPNAAGAGPRPRR